MFTNPVTGQIFVITPHQRGYQLQPYPTATTFQQHPIAIQGQPVQPPNPIVSASQIRHQIHGSPIVTASPIQHHIQRPPVVTSTPIQHHIQPPRHQVVVGTPPIQQNQASQQSTSVVTPTRSVQHQATPSQTTPSLPKERGKWIEKAITHYIDGMLIFETAKPIGSEKKKSKRRSNGHSVEERKQQTQQPKQEPQQQQQQQQRQSQPEQPQQQDDDVQKVRAEMPYWSVAQVVEFIEKHPDIRQYSSKFAEDEVDGKALQLMIDRNLNFQILTSMFKHGPAMKIEATLSRYKIKD